MNNIIDKVNVNVEQRFKTVGGFRFVELLNPKFTKKFPMEAFSTLDVHKNIFDLDGPKFKLKLVYVAIFAKQASSI